MCSSSSCRPWKYQAALAGLGAECEGPGPVFSRVEPSPDGRYIATIYAGQLRLFDLSDYPVTSKVVETIPVDESQLRELNLFSGLPPESPAEDVVAISALVRAPPGGEKRGIALSHGPDILRRYLHISIEVDQVPGGERQSVQVLDPWRTRRFK